ncbi:hypothetical protein RESH_04332 [Rhodopirellula europaea SH398]|uniref:Uncharacterized protein n=1 Tax=Rhodopirellula europaea SH398 TaxID=1263868 RepID=M5SBQ0_9BACT|nr:hypothetical protein RESH_04332 [Rhodopirellula europaea SH398]
MLNGRLNFRQDALPTERYGSRGRRERSSTSKNHDSATRRASDCSPLVHSHNNLAELIRR